MSFGSKYFFTTISLLFASRPPTTRILSELMNHLSFSYHLRFFLTLFLGTETCSIAMSFLDLIFSSCFLVFSIAINAPFVFLFAFLAFS